MGYHVGDRLGEYKDTTKTPRTTFHIHRDFLPDPRALSEQLCDSAKTTTLTTTSITMQRTHEHQRPIVNQLIKVYLRPIILRWQPRLHERCAVITLDELLFEPRKCWTKVSA